MIYWILATLTAFFIKGLCGFANTLVSVSYTHLTLPTSDLV